MNYFMDGKKGSKSGISEEEKANFKREQYSEGLQKGAGEVNEDDDKENSSLVYVKKWMKTKHAIMFRLSNRLVQVRILFLCDCGRRASPIRPRSCSRRCTRW